MRSDLLTAPGSGPQFSVTVPNAARIYDYLLLRGRAPPGGYIYGGIAVKR
jgi:hypothetical protein